MICSDCTEQLDDEQSADPEHSTDGEVICDECYHERYRDECLRCGNTVDKTELEARPGDVIALLSKESGLTSELEPGYYRVKEWPFFASRIIEAYFYADRLERVADLDEKALNAVEFTYCCSIPLCADCRQSISETLDRGRS